MNIMRIGVYGLGRFGRLWAELLGRCHEVWGFNRRELRNPPSRVRLVGEEELFLCDAVFFCVTISALPDVLERTARYMRPGTLVADTCSVKLLPGKWMDRAVPEGVHVLGTHPMFGPDSVRNGWEGLPLVLCPVRLGEETLRGWTDIFSGFGLRVIVMTADEHDHQAAYSQGVTHFIGRVLDDLGIGEAELATLGYRKILEVKQQTCNDPWQLFLDLQRYNPYTEEMRMRLTISLDRVMEAIAPPAGESETDDPLDTAGGRR